MAGSFGYEEEHYEISMQMGEDTLFPKNRSPLQQLHCRSRYKLPPSNFDGTNRKTQHPVSILNFSEIISAFDSLEGRNCSLKARFTAELPL
jgi:hypothetical protein